VRRPVAIGLAAAALAGLAVWLVRSPEALAPLARVSPASLAGLVLVSAAALALQGVQFGVVARLFGVRLRGVEWLGLTCVNNLLTYALPVRGGTLVRAAYLARVHALPLHAYAALTVSSHVVITGVACVGGMLLALGLAARGAAPPSWLLATFVAAPVAVAAGAWLLAAASERVAGASLALAEHARAFRASLGIWRRRRAHALAFAGVTVGVFLLHGLRMLVALRAVGLSPAWPAAFLVHAGAAASAVLAVTPANLGTREAVVALLAAALGLDPRAAVLAALVERAVATLEAALGSAVLMGPLRRRLESGPPPG
jgi:uncharacterized membrane protein YbhN (UPF0104 family)